MTEIVVPRQVRLMPDAPLTTDPPVIFDEKAIALAAWYPNWVGDNNNQAADNNQNATAAQERATAAQGFRNQAEGFADQAQATKETVDGQIAIVNAALEALASAGAVLTVNGRGGVVVGLQEASIAEIYTKASTMASAPLWKRVAYTSLNGAGSDWPTNATISFWHVFTYGVSEEGNDRYVQIAEQVYIQGGQGYTFKRVKHDATWSRWKRVFTDDNIVESTTGGAITTSSYTLDPAVASVHHKSLQASTTINLPVPRGGGDQVTLALYQGGSYSIAFSANVAPPIGATIPAVAAGEMLLLTFIASYDGNNKWNMGIAGRYPG